EWAGSMASYLEDELLNVSHASTAEKSQLDQQIQNLAGSGAVQRMLATFCASETAARETRLFALDAVKRSRAKDLPDAWFVVKVPRSNAPELVQHAAAAAGAVAFRTPDALRGELLKVASNASLPAPTRLEALNAISGSAAMESALFSL